MFRKNPTSRSDLDANQYQKIDSDITITNWKRLRIFMALTLLFEILIILFNDIPAINAAVPDQLWLAQSYLALHIVIGTTCLIGVILSMIFLKNSPEKGIGKTYLSAGLPLIVLICLSVITGLDQIRTGDISAFVINLLVCSALLVLPFRVSFFLFTIPFGIFIAALVEFQPDLAVRNSHFINGGIFWVAVLVISKFMYDNHVSHLVKNIRLEQINQQLEAANEKLSILSFHDPLTNLSNRRNFEARIEQELAQIKRFKQCSWLVLIDIDHFKDINDRFGHATGDRVLQEVAAFLQKNIRDVDLACRWGGEEFLLLITRTELDEVTQLANRLCTKLAQSPLDIDGKMIQVTSSFGIAMLADEKDFQTSYRLADQALYTAKHQGRNQFVIADQ